MYQPLLVLAPGLLGFAASAVASSVYDLSKASWTLRNTAGNVSVPAKIPSVAHIDLFRAGVIGEPMYADNDDKQLWVVKSEWTYESEGLKLPNTTVPQQTFLVFDGLDTYAFISFCNQTVGKTNNQFRQWIFDVTSILQNRTAVCRLAVTFMPVTTAAEILSKAYNYVELYSPISVFANRSVMRKEQSDFGWDWSPAFVPAGIWQPAYLVQLNAQGPSTVHVANSAVDIFREGQLNNLPPDQTKSWMLNISLDYVGPTPKVQSLDFEIVDSKGQKFTADSITNVTVTRKVIEASIKINGNPELWWPVGYGNQALYTLNIKVIGSERQEVATVSRRIGFRTIVLNQTPITDEQLALGISPGANWHFEINGRELFVKGSNLVPLDVFWPNVTESSARQLLKTAVSGNQNMLRVWASGAYLPDFIYDIADELGLLLWSEFQFSDAIYPTDDAFLDNVFKEAYYQTRRVNHHPSLALWCGNNELALILMSIAKNMPESFQEHNQQYMKLFLDVLLRAVFDNSRSISYSFSSTTNGYISLNHSAPMPMMPRFNFTEDGIYGNTDYYNYDATQAFNISQYPISRLANEFGFPSHANFETYARYLPASSLVSNSSLIVHRNRHYVDMLSNDSTPTGNTNQSLYGLGHIGRATSLFYPSSNQADSLTKFKTEVYSSQLFQAEFYRSQIEFYRYGSGQPQRTLGSLYWQLNDVWAAPTWSSINADGHWKILHYVSRATYENVIIAPYTFDCTPNETSIYVSSDLWTPVSASVGIEWFNWAGQTVHTHSPTNITIGPVNSTLAATIDLSTLPFNPAEAVAFLTVNASTLAGKTYTHTRVFTPRRLTDPTVLASITANATATASPVTLSYDRAAKVFVVQSTALAGWVWLEQPEGVKGHFQENAFWMLPGRKTVAFVMDRETEGGLVQRVAEEAFEAWAARVTVRSLWDSI